jgi:predicted  nucleic acid-binding Zn-ribbon protein
MQSIADRILEVQKDIRNIENNIARNEGLLDSIIKDLKANFNIDSVEDAEKLLEELEKKLREKQEEYKQKVEELKVQFPEYCGDL